MGIDAPVDAQVRVVPGDSALVLGGVGAVDLEEQFAVVGEGDTTAGEAARRVELLAAFGAQPGACPT